MIRSLISLSLCELTFLTRILRLALAPVPIKDFKRQFNSCEAVKTLEAECSTPVAAAEYAFGGAARAKVRTQEGMALVIRDFARKIDVPHQGPDCVKT